MNIPKPYRRTSQAATQVKVLSPVIINVAKVDAFHGVGRQHSHARKWREHVGFAGVLGRGMTRDGLHVNLGDPCGSQPVDAGGYLSTSCKRQGDRDDYVEVGSARSTLSTGKPCTWGRGRRGEASGRNWVFTSHRGRK